MRLWILSGILLLLSSCDRKAVVRFQLPDKMESPIIDGRVDMMWVPIARHAAAVCVPVVYLANTDGIGYKPHRRGLMEGDFVGNPYIVEQVRGREYGIILWKTEQPDDIRYYYFSPDQLVFDGRIRDVTLPGFETLPVWQESDLSACE